MSDTIEGPYEVDQMAAELEEICADFEALREAVDEVEAEAKPSRAEKRRAEREESKRDEKAPNHVTRTGHQLDALLGALRDGAIETALDYEDAEALAELIEVLEAAIKPAREANKMLFRKHSGGKDQMGADQVEARLAYLADSSALMEKERALDVRKVSRGLPIVLPRPKKIAPKTLLAIRDAGAGLVEFAKAGKEG